MSFGKKIIAGVAAVATLAALAPAVAMADTAQNQNSATSSQAKEEYATVTFYTADGHSIQESPGRKAPPSPSTHSASRHRPSRARPSPAGLTPRAPCSRTPIRCSRTSPYTRRTRIPPTQDDNTQYTVSFYAGADQLIQTVSYYAKDKAKFSQYALGIQAPAVEGKTFTGWGFASNDGNVAVNPDAEVTGNWAVYPMYKDTPTSEDKTLNTVSFYNTKNELIQTVSYYAKDKVKFSTYAAGIQAPAVEGKTFTGWGFASNDGDVAVDPNTVVTGNWAVYPMYKNAEKEG